MWSRCINSDGISIGVVNNKDMNQHFKTTCLPKMPSECRTLKIRLFICNLSLDIWKSCSADAVYRPSANTLTNQVLANDLVSILRTNDMLKMAICNIWPEGEFKNKVGFLTLLIQQCFSAPSSPISYAGSHPRVDLKYIPESGGTDCHAGILVLPHSHRFTWMSTSAQK